MNPLLYVDFYKPHHQDMYPEGMTKLYSNLTPRKSRIAGINAVVTFGIQHFCLEYLIKKFNEEFFLLRSRNSSTVADMTPERKEEFLGDIKKKVISEYRRHVPINTHRIEALWDLGYLPIEIKALDEGTLCPIGVPMMTITNTHPDFGWLVNYLETLISCMLWQPITSATIAREYKKILTHYAKETDKKNIGFIDWQGHDFSMRGLSSVESAILSGMGHLLSFTGTDTIPAIYQLETSYNAKGLVGASVPATEHSVQCMGTKEGEIETFRRLLKIYQDAPVLSIVSDTWNLWDVVGPGGLCEQLKEKILARPGKLVIRPDSGDPVDIICGKDDGVHRFQSKDDLYDFLHSCEDNEGDIIEWEGNYYEIVDVKSFIREYGSDQWNQSISTHRPFNDLISGSRVGILDPCDAPTIKEVERKGVIELLWDIFGGTINEQGYKVLDPHIGAIYGDSITMDRAVQICERLKAKGFASTNIVLGIGSYTYQYNTRDTFGFAMKATYGEITHEKSDWLPSQSPEALEPAQWSEIEPREIFKDPITDDGTKKSKKGLLTVRVKEVGSTLLECIDQRTWEQEQTGLLTTVFKDGKMTKITSLEEIRERLK